MSYDEKSGPPPGFGAQGIDLTVVSNKNFLAAEAEAKEFEDSLEDMPLSKEAVSARNRFFVACLVVIVVTNSTDVEISSSFFKAKFSHGIGDLRFLAFVVAMALGAHYGFAAFSEYISEGAVRRERMERISKAISNSEKYARVIAEYRQKCREATVVDECNASINRWNERAVVLKDRLLSIKKRHTISLIYGAAIPSATILVLSAILLVNLCRSTVGG